MITHKQPSGFVDLIRPGAEASIESQATSFLDLEAGAGW